MKKQYFKPEVTEYKLRMESLLQRVSGEEPPTEEEGVSESHGNEDIWDGTIIPTDEAGDKLRPGGNI